MIADKHYLSDVLVGAAIGLASGALLPALVNYRQVGPLPAGR
jgi:membrane-associated phospholipid phosphatase